MRLGVKEQTACSSASLRIKKTSFQCKKNNTNFGSVFQKEILSNSQFVYILLTLHATSSPTMVWLKIVPKGISSYFSLNLLILPNYYFISGEDVLKSTTELSKCRTYHINMFIYNVIRYTCISHIETSQRLG